MTRKEFRRIVEDIIESIEPVALDDSGLYIPRAEIDRAVDLIMELFDGGFVYDLPTKGS